MADGANIVANVISGSSVTGGSTSGASITANVDASGNAVNSNLVQGNTINSDNTDGSIVQTNVVEGQTVEGQVSVGAKGDKGDTGATGATGAEGPQGPQGEPGTGADLAIGEPITGSEPNRFLLSDGSGNLTDSPYRQTHVELLGGLVQGDMLTSVDVGGVEFGFVDASAVGGGMLSGWFGQSTDAYGVTITDIDTLNSYLSMTKTETSQFGIAIYNQGLQVDPYPTFLVYNGLMTLNNTQPISAFSNDPALADASEDDLVTEYAAKTYADNIIPTQTGNSGKFLTTDGTDVSWATVSASPGGSDTQIQFNDGGSFGGESNFTWNKTDKTLTLTGKSEQTADLLQIRNDTPFVVSGADSRGVLYSRLTDDNSLIMGYLSGRAAATGTGNIGLGSRTVRNLTSGSQNVAIGLRALDAVTTGNFNFGLGSQTGLAVTTGSNNIFIGMEAGKVTGNNVQNAVAIGLQAGFSLASGFNVSTLVGNYSGRTATGTHNSGLGNATLELATGSFNTAVGSNAGKNSGARGVYLGYRAGFNETGNDKLYIANTDTATPLIYGDFSTGELTVNGHFEVNGTNEVLATGAGASVDDVITALQALGLVKQS